MKTILQRSINKKKKKVLLTLILAAALLINEEHNKNKRQWWVRPWLDRKKGNHNLHREFLMCQDLWSYRNFLRMNEELFKELLQKCERKISKKDTKFRECIPAETKLIITLRYLATGETFRSLMYNYRVSESAISRFIPIVCKAIYETLKLDYLQVPKTAVEWKQVSEKFEKHWNLPNVIGALDGKHVIIKAPSGQGSAFFNYKKQHSIVLLGLVDASYKFIYVNIGVNGRVSDGGVFRESDLREALERNTLNLPEDQPLPRRTEPVPFVIVADAAFPLTHYILKPYPFKNLTLEQRIFNYRLSRARRVVENAFGILANRFRILLNVNNLSPTKTVLVTHTCCALHNFLTMRSATYLSANVNDDIDTNYSFKYGLGRQCGNRSSGRAIQIREEFKEYVNGCGSVPWQRNMI